jgi:hypothetical protein
MHSSRIWRESSFIMKIFKSQKSDIYLDNYTDDDDDDDGE